MIYAAGREKSSQHQRNSQESSSPLIFIDAFVEWPILNRKRFADIAVPISIVIQNPMIQVSVTKVRMDL